MIVSDRAASHKTVSGAYRPPGPIWAIHDEDFSVQAADKVHKPENPG